MTVPTLHCKIILQQKPCKSDWSRQPNASKVNRWIICHLFPTGPLKTLWGFCVSMSKRGWIAPCRKRRATACKKPALCSNSPDPLQRGARTRQGPVPQCKHKVLDRPPPSKSRRALNQKSPQPLPKPSNWQPLPPRSKRCMKHSRAIKAAH